MARSGGLLLLTLVGQSVVGLFEFNSQQTAQGREGVSYLQYLGTSDFSVDVAENWQSEFLQFYLPLHLRHRLAGPAGLH